VIFAYHRLARSWDGYAWWKPLVTALIGAAIYLALSLLLGVVALALAFAFPDFFGDFLSKLTAFDVDLSDPLILAFALGSIALLLPSVILATLIMGPRPVGLLSSAAGHLRWRWLLRCLPLALAVYAVVFGLSFLVLDPALGAEPVRATVGPSTVALIVLALVLTPLQATAEEYVFRGFLGQTIGGWLRHPAWAILLPVPLFAIGHTQYDVWGILDVSIFAVFAGWLTWRTGGLEAAIAAHVVNNTILFVLGSLDLVDANADAGSLYSLLTTVVIMAAYSALVVWQARRIALPVSRAVHPVPLQPAAPQPAAVPAPTLGA
jgi:membrane protease YdiL (CAAX protease family)